MFLRFIHVVACISTPFLFDGWLIFHRICSPSCLSIPSSMRVWVIYCSCLWCCGAHVFERLFSILLSIALRNRPAGSYSNSVFSLSGSHQTDFQSDWFSGWLIFRVRVSVFSTSLSTVIIFHFFNVFFKRHFCCGPFLKSLLNLLSYYFCFMFGFFGCKACEISAPPSRDRTLTLALKGRVSTTVTPGESLWVFLFCWLLSFWVWSGIPLWFWFPFPYWLMMLRLCSCASWPFA